MVEGLIGMKIGMTQTFDETGNVIPVTAIKAGPCTVIQKKTQEKDGYSIVQLSLVEESGQRSPRSLLSAIIPNLGFLLQKPFESFCLESKEKSRRVTSFLWIYFRLERKFT